MSKWKKEMNFKKNNQKDQAEHTLSHVNGELQKRKDELDKINNLDKKIQLELENLDNQQISMTNEINQFKSPEDIELFCKQTKVKLLKDKMQTQQEKEAMEQKVLESAQQLDKISEELNSNKYHTELEDLENKIAKLSQNIFFLLKKA